MDRQFFLKLERELASAADMPLVADGAFADDFPFKRYAAPRTPRLLCPVYASHYNAFTLIMAALHMGWIVTRYSARHWIYLARKAIQKRVSRIVGDPRFWITLAAAGWGAFAGLLLILSIIKLTG